MKKHLFILSLFIGSFGIQSKAQESTAEISLEGFLEEVTDTSPILLPERMIPTQSILWGKRGIMRNFSYFELTPEKRQRELELRRKMLGLHQILGFATLGGMIAQGFVGAKLYTDPSIKGIHEGLGAGVNIAYFTTAGLSLFAPPKMIRDGKGYSSIKLHKVLGVIHLTSMIATNFLAGPAAENPIYKPYHRAAAFTAFGTFALSMIVIKF